MAKREPRMIPLGYGKFVRADRIYALVPLEYAVELNRLIQLQMEGSVG